MLAVGSTYRICCGPEVDQERGSGRRYLIVSSWGLCLSGYRVGNSGGSLPCPTLEGLRSLMHRDVGIKFQSRKKANGALGWQVYKRQGNAESAPLGDVRKRGLHHIPLPIRGSVCSSRESLSRSRGIARSLTLPPAIGGNFRSGASD